MSIPYTYLIGWSNKDTFYYGVRYADGCHPSDFWKTYFTSSNFVKRFFKEYGWPDIIEIRKTFNDVDSARLWESKVLRRIDARSDERFLNKVNIISPFPRPGKDNHMFGLKHTDETKSRISKTKLSEKKLTCNKCGKKVSNGNYYRWHGDQCGMQKSSGTEKMIKVENTIYASMTEASRALGVCKGTITYRIKSNNFNYNIVGDSQ